MNLATKDTNLCSQSFFIEALNELCLVLPKGHALILNEDFPVEGQVHSYILVGRKEPHLLDIWYIDGESMSVWLEWAMVDYDHIKFHPGSPFGSAARIRNEMDVRTLMQEMCSEPEPLICSPERTTNPIYELLEMV